MRILVCDLILNEYLIKESCDFQSLAIGTAIAKIL